MAHRIRQAKVAIPIIRDQVEALGQTYSHKLVACVMKPAPPDIQARLHLTNQDDALFLERVHLSDATPFAFERRWINPQAVPDILSAPLETISANEWLMKSVPFPSARVVFTAETLDPILVKIFDASQKEASFTIHRTSWIGERFITMMTLHYRPGYELHIAL